MKNWAIQENWASDFVEIFIYESQSPTPHKRIVTAVEFTDSELDEGYCADPSFRIKREEAQQIINELWRIGFRPKNGNGAVAHTEALDKHLQDLRTIAFHALKIPTS